MSPHRLHENVKKIAFCLALLLISQNLSAKNWQHSDDGLKIAESIAFGVSALKQASLVHPDDDLRRLNDSILRKLTALYQFQKITFALEPRRKKVPECQGRHVFSIVNTRRDRRTIADAQIAFCQSSLDLRPVDFSYHFLKELAFLSKLEVEDHFDIGISCGSVEFAANILYFSGFTSDLKTNELSSCNVQLPTIDAPKAEEAISEPPEPTPSQKEEEKKEPSPVKTPQDKADDELTSREMRQLEREARKKAREEERRLERERKQREREKQEHHEAEEKKRKAEERKKHEQEKARLQKRAESQKARQRAQRQGDSDDQLRSVRRSSNPMYTALKIGLESSGVIYED